MQADSPMTAPSPLSQPVSCRRPQGPHLPQPHPLPSSPYGVEWFSFTNPRGQVRTRRFPLPRSLANVKRGFSEKNWTDAKNWVKKRLGKTTSNRKYRPAKNGSRTPRWRGPTSSLANTSTGPHDAQAPRAGGASISSRLVSTCSRTFRNEVSRRPSGQPSWRPRSFRAQPGGGPASSSRSCLPTSGAARRS